MRKLMVHMSTTLGNALWLSFMLSHCSGYLCDIVMIHILCKIFKDILESYRINKHIDTNYKTNMTYSAFLHN